MTTVYNKKGEEFKVVHKIDVKEWLAAGYTLKKPMTAAEKKKAAAEAKNAEAEKKKAEEEL